MKKRILSLAMAAAMMAVTVTGCGKSSDLTGDEIVAEVGDTQIKVGVAEFLARFEQAQYETYQMPSYGEEMWSYPVAENMTYEDSVKANILYTVESMYVLEDHMDEYGVKLSSEDEALIDAAAKAFIEANDAEVLAVINGTEEAVKEVLRLYTVQQKMYEAMILDVDSVVSDDEAAQKKMDYVFLSTHVHKEDGTEKQFTDAELSDMKKVIEKFHADLSKGDKTFDECVAEAKLDKVSISFDADTITPNVELIKEASTLGVGQVTNIITVDDGYYVGQVTSLFDKDATEAKKEKIIEERKQTLYNDLCAKWMEEAEITEYEEIWKQIDFEKEGVLFKSAEEETKNK